NFSRVNVARSVNNLSSIVCDRIDSGSLEHLSMGGMMLQSFAGDDEFYTSGDVYRSGTAELSDDTPGRDRQAPPPEERGLNPGRDNRGNGGFSPSRRGSAFSNVPLKLLDVLRDRDAAEDVLIRVSGQPAIRWLWS